MDTHVKRISRKLGLTRQEDPEKIEYDLMKVLPEDHWILWNIHVITLGRTICTARSPRCGECFLRCLCPSAEDMEKEKTKKRKQGILEAERESGYERGQKRELCEDSEPVYCS